MSEAALAVVEQQVDIRLDARLWSENMRVRLDNFGKMLERHTAQREAMNAEMAEFWQKLKDEGSWFA